jgi:hypothetical protein
MDDYKALIKIVLAPRVADLMDSDYPNQNRFIYRYSTKSCDKFFKPLIWLMAYNFNPTI